MAFCQRQVSRNYSDFKPNAFLQKRSFFLRGLKKMLFFRSLLPAGTGFKPRFSVTYELLSFCDIKENSYLISQSPMILLIVIIAVT
jgi:hypothetical protein